MVMKKLVTPRKLHDHKPLPTEIFDRDKGSLRERVYSCLRIAILSGKFQPQARLVEESVARKLGVSRTPVRESLHKLEREGLIEHVRNRGFKLRTEGEGQIAEIFEIRALLEGYILRIACERATDEFLSDLKSLVRKGERCFAQSKIEELRRVNTLFHDRIVQQVTGKERLKGLIKDLREYVLHYRSVTLKSRGGAKRTLEGHKRIILALETGDAGLCERTMRDHIERAEADAIGELTEKEMSALPLMT
jgi:DNA-binding GntR family transcriptional regulator